MERFMDIQNIYELLRRFSDSCVQELELRMGGDTIRMKKADGGPSPQRGDEGGGSQVQKTQRAEKDQTEQTEQAQDKKTGRVQRAPLAGTFYRAPSPEAEAFVSPGQQVHKGDIVGIIEAMKLMNEVAVEEDGIVEEILVEDGALVAFDEELIRYV